MDNQEKQATEKLMVDISAAMTDFYRKSYADNVKRQMLRRAKAGYAVHRPPLGYSKTSKPGLFVINSKGKAMAELLNKYADDKISSTELLNALGLVFNPLPKSISTKHKLYDCVCNPYYSGYVVYNDEEFEGRHEALLPAKKLWLIGSKLYAEIRKDFPLYR